MSCLKNIMDRHQFLHLLQSNKNFLECNSFKSTSNGYDSWPHKWWLIMNHSISESTKQVWKTVPRPRKEPNKIESPFRFVIQWRKFHKQRTARLAQKSQGVHFSEIPNFPWLHISIPIKKLKLFIRMYFPLPTSTSSESRRKQHLEWASHRLKWRKAWTSAQQRKKLSLLL